MSVVRVCVPLSKFRRERKIGFRPEECSSPEVCGGPFGGVCGCSSVRSVCARYSGRPTVLCRRVGTGLGLCVYVGVCPVDPTVYVRAWEDGRWSPAVGEGGTKKWSAVDTVGRRKKEEETETVDAKKKEKGKKKKKKRREISETIPGKSKTHLVVAKRFGNRFAGTGVQIKCGQCQFCKRI